MTTWESAERDMGMGCSLGLGVKRPTIFIWNRSEGQPSTGNKARQMMGRAQVEVGHGEMQQKSFNMATSTGVVSMVSGYN